MSTRHRKIPDYTRHKATGQAVVRLDGRDVYLGKHNTPASREKYDRTIAEWLTARRIASPAPLSTGTDAQPSPLTVNELILAFWKHAQDHYRSPDGEPTGELVNIKAALRPLRQLYGTTPAAEFGPLGLRSVRQSMIAAGLMRTTINARVNRVRRAFRWAVSMELIPPTILPALKAVDGLLKGRTKAREPEPVDPVSKAVVDQTLPYLSGPVAGLVQLQQLTGMRPGEACAVRGRDLEFGDPTGTYRPASHKTAWKGKGRAVVLGPRAQELLRSFVKTDPAECLFDPRDAVAEHHAARTARRKSKPTPSELAKRKADPGRNHARRYTRLTYRNAVSRACDKAFPHPELSAIPRAKLTADQAAELREWRKSHRWRPNQLRHTVATEVRARYGLEASQTVLGHSRADVTQIYAERDVTKAREVMAQMG